MYIPDNQTQGDTSAADGTVIIADISGFKSLVYGTDLLAGRNIVRTLLSAIISANQLNLPIAEIEGDAVFYYRFGEAPSHQEIVAMYEAMLQEFIHTANHLTELKKRRIPLSLKMIAHSGHMASYQIGRFDKLYGKVVTEAHLLLKNQVKSHTYVLITRDFLQQNRAGQMNGMYWNSQCKTVSGMRKLCYHSFDYTLAISSGKFTN